MKRIKRRLFAGCVCEQEVYSVADWVDVKQARPPRQRFKTEEERQQHRNMISARKWVNYINENFGTTSFYTTQTFAQDYECHTADECKELMQAYIRRLKYKYPEAVIAAVYGQGKKSSRFHLHMIIEGIPEEYIRKQWTYGSVIDCDRLREHNFYQGMDHGQDYTALAMYLFNHWKPEFGGHRWFLTRNARKPEQEQPKEVKREYSEQKPPRAPKGYILVETRSTPYGLLYFKYIRIPEKTGRKKQ